MSALQRFDRVRRECGSLGVVVGLPSDDIVYFWPDKVGNYFEVPADKVTRVFGPGDEVVAGGLRRTVVGYTRNQCYRLREHDYGTTCDYYAWEITPAGQ
ncbi:hypothetical protein [Microbispora bryophytorum]|uniref:hypothetical protein n=1 Tax=Microbispora bryophytorum TaxID=1460882 RepID=UPI0033DBFAC3